jgi:molybdopterin molybdotransferase
MLVIARDNVPDLKRQIIAGLENDVLLVSGGVSMGKYDLVERVFNELGINIHFESVSMRPGKPTVFATLGNRFVYGLPGNPVSTFVAFELFVKPVLNRLQGLRADALCLVRGAIQNEVSEKSGRTAFLPAKVSSKSGKTKISLVSWKGSADIFSVVQAKGFLVVPLETTHLNFGDEAEALMFDELEFESESQF